MPETTLTINHADGGSETYTINRDKFEGVRNMARKLGVDAGDPENITEFTASGSSNVNLNGTFTLNVSGWQRPNADGYIRYFKSGTQWFYRDYDGEEGTNTVISNDDVTYPWQITNWLVSPPTLGSFVGGTPASIVTDTVSVDHTPAEDLRNLLIDAENITINRDKGEAIRTLFIDGVEVTIDRTGEVIVQRLLDLFQGASAAYSLQSLKGTADQALINARRSSDGVEVDVYPDSSANREVSADSPITVTSGSSSATTFGDFLTEDVTIYSQSSDLLITGGDGAQFTLPANSTNIQSGKAYRVTFELKRNAGGAGDLALLSLKLGSTFNYTVSSKTSNLSENPNRFDISSATEEYQEYSITFTADAGTSPSDLRFRTFDADDDYTVRNATIEVINPDAFVTTWYDQAGSNDATQSLDDAQPKIAAGGSVLGALDFDGVDDFLKTIGTLSLTQPITSFSLCNTNLAANSRGVWTIAVNDTTTGEIVSFFRSDSGLATNAGATLTTAGSLSYTNGVDYLKSSIFNTTSSSIFVNGTSHSTGTVGTNNPAGFLYVGRMNVGSSSLKLDGTISELIIYDSDQSANREAIEANINGRYSIY